MLILSGATKVAAAIYHMAEAPRFGFQVIGIVSVGRKAVGHALLHGDVAAC